MTTMEELAMKPLYDEQGRQQRPKLDHECTPEDRIDIRLLNAPPPSKWLDIDPAYLTFEDCAFFEPRLKRIENRIKAIRRKNFQLKGSWELDAFYGQALWEGTNGLVSIWEQITDCVGRYSDTPYEELRSDEVYETCRKHLIRLHTGREAL